MEIVYKVLLWIFVAHQGGRSQVENCDLSLGMQDKLIPDESITASSTLSSKHSPSRARLDGQGAWCSGQEESPYIEISLDEEKLITSVTTQGSGMDAAWATKYEIKYIENGNWTAYPKELMGNRNSISLKKNTLQPPIRTRSIRIYPKDPRSASFIQTILVACLRLELYGCSAPVGCQDPGNPVNGDRVGESFDHGEQITFACRQGFVLIGSATSVCHKGTWSHSIPECKATCPDPGIPNNGKRLGDKFVDGDSVRFACHERYTLIGPEAIRCLGNKWSSDNPQCKASCSNPGTPQNGKRIGSDFLHGKHVQFTCQSGFWLDGSRLIECKEGNWSNPTPTCKALCSDPGVPANGYRIGDDFGDGQMVAYRCNPGFNLDGSATAFCLAGQWNATQPTCKASCKDPGVPENGRRVGSNFAHRSLVTFVCRREFSLVGSQSITCHDGRWSSGIPVCRAACRDPGSPANGVKHGNEFSHNKQVRYSCLPGFQLTGSSSLIVCINGKWSGSVPECKAVCTEPKTPLNGERIGSNFLDGQQVAFRCQSGYTLIGPQVIRCVKGKWDKTEPVCRVFCNDPGVPANGNRTGDDFRDGNVVAFTCQIGYKMIGSRSITCRDGRWSSAVPRCQKLCKIPDKLDNGVIRGDRLASDDIIEFACRSGFKLIGSDVLRCVKGAWNSSIPECRKESCSNPGVPANGRRLSEDFGYGKRVTFACRFGYKLIGRRTIICQDGIWSSSIPKCHKRCKIPDKPDNGFIRRDRLASDDVIKFACRSGFKLIGSNVLHCVNGVWNSSIPECRKESCSNPGVPANGRRLDEDFAYGKSVTFACRFGYKLIGRRTIICQDGIWSSSTPKCQKICRIPAKPDNGDIINDRFRSDSVIEFTCNSGYELIGSRFLRCIDGLWNSSQPECRKAPATPAHGSYDARDFSSGASVRFSCEPNYSLVGYSVITCLNGKWIEKPPVCLAVCPPPVKIAHGSYQGSSFSRGANVTYSCDAQYTLEGSPVIICVDGRWNGKIPACRAPCSSPQQPLHGFVFGDGPFHMSTVQYWCEEGYTLRGSSTAQCIDGRWNSPPPVCEAPIGCRRPDSPANGYIASDLLIREWFSSGDRVFYRCDQGYAPFGLGLRQCKKGQWTKMEFKCNAISCGPPDEVPNGNVKGWQFTLNSLVRYTCNAGYELVGPSERICQANRTWNGTLPQCKEVDCGNLPVPNNAIKVIQTSTTLNGQVKFECVGMQFKLLGSSTRTCQPNGEWSGQQPVCQLILCGDPGTPGHGSRMIHRGFYHGSSVEFNCDAAYTMDGSPRIFCKNGIWSDPKPRCLAPCTNPGSPRHGRKIGNDFKHNRSVRFRCNRNFRLLGSNKITCIDGRWMKKSPNDNTSDFQEPRCVRRSS